MTRKSYLIFLNDDIFQNSKASHKKNFRNNYAIKNLYFYSKASDNGYMMDEYQTPITVPITWY